MLIKSASRKKSGAVIELDPSQIYDFADVVNQTVARKVKVKVSKVSSFSYTSEEVLYRYSALKELVRLDAKFNRIRSIHYKPLNKKDFQPIKKAKKKDLLYLCNKLAIPKPYHSFYQNLKKDPSANDEADEQYQTSA